MSEQEYNANEKLRKAVYDILMSSSSENIKFPELSLILKDKYKVDISPEILEHIFEEWDRRKDYTYFKKQDEKWLDVWLYMKYIKRKARYKQNFGKHRWKNWDWRENSGTTTYWRGGYNYNDRYYD